MKWLNLDCGCQSKTDDQNLIAVVTLTLSLHCLRKTERTDFTDSRCLITDCLWINDNHFSNAVCEKEKNSSFTLWKNHDDCSERNEWDDSCETDD